MANEQDVKDELVKLRQVVADDQAADQATFDAQVAVRKDLEKQVQDLKDQIAAGQTPTVDFDGIIAAMKEIEASVKPTTEAPATPPSGETPVPVTGE